MEISIAKYPIWEEIELSESYLVCGMSEEAASIASSVLKHLRDGQCTEDVEDDELNDLLESAGMVLVQSLKELGRTTEILKELKLLFGSVTTIPVQVFLIGVCFQIPEGPSSSVCDFLKDFLNKWRYVDGKYYALADMEVNPACTKVCNSQLVLGVDEYFELVEIYVVTLLALVMGDMDLAISWVEEAALPEEKRQELLRRLQSVCSSKVTTSLQAFASSLVTTDCETHAASLKELNLCGGSKEVLEAQCSSNGENRTKQAILKLPGRKVSCFWWFHTITLKLGNHRFVISNGNILLGCLLFLMYYFMRRKQTSLLRILKMQALSIKKALVDLWQLAFSYQVNPLAAVQPLPAMTRGNR